MCGIAGIFAAPESRNRFDELFAAIAHRGPDSCGTYRDGKIEMGMHRLTFRGKEMTLPITENDSILAYNGQIYGHFAADGRFTELEDGLSNEVRAASLHGARADGMYAYSSYSPEFNEVLLSTDPHFIKPLFYRQDGESNAFCSELAPLLRMGMPNRLNIDALAELFAYGWYLSDRTFVDGLHLVWKNDVALTASGARLVPKSPACDPRSAAHADADALRGAIRASVARCLRGSGPIGLALSGGLDSSILAWELNDLGFRDLVCITVSTDDGSDAIRSLSDLHLPSNGAWRHWKHVVANVGSADFVNLFKSSVLAFGQPTTMSSLPLYHRLAELASAEGIRALLLGEGVDEYFAGYSSYAKVTSAEAVGNYHRHPPREKLVAELFGPKTAERVRRRFADSYGHCDDLRAIEVPMRLTRLLLRSDVCLMARSIEGRVPFLYNNIPALAMSVPWERLRAPPGKTVLRSAYAGALQERANVAKVRFKSSDSVLLESLAHDGLEDRIVAAAGRAFGRPRVARALEWLKRPAGFDADTLCLLMSLTFLIENGDVDDVGVS